MADQGILYAVVDFDGAAYWTVRQVVIFFEDACATDRYAIQCGYPDYLIAPVAFDLSGPTTSSGRPGLIRQRTAGSGPNQTFCRS